MFKGVKEAKSFGEFDSIKGFGPNDIKREKHNSEFNEILDMPRGEGIGCGVMILSMKRSKP